MRTDTARAISTVAIWTAVATVLTNLRINGHSDTVISVFIGMTSFLSISAAIGTVAVWRSSRPAESPKDIDREL